MLTDEGLALVADRLLAAFGSAQIVVGNRTDPLEHALDADFPRLSEDGQSLVFQATFGPEEANIEWNGEGLKLDGKIVEWEDRDGGRKALGATWTVQVELGLTA